MKSLFESQLFLLSCSEYRSTDGHWKAPKRWSTIINVTPDTQVQWMGTFFFTRNGWIITTTFYFTTMMKGYPCRTSIWYPTVYLVYGLFLAKWRRHGHRFGMLLSWINTQRKREREPVHIPGIQLWFLGLKFLRLMIMALRGEEILDVLFYFNVSIKNKGGNVLYRMNIYAFLLLTRKNSLSTFPDLILPPLRE